MTTQVFGLSIKNQNAAELTQYYADALVADGWEWMPNTDPNKVVDTNNAIFIATKNGHAFDVTIGPSAEGTGYSAFMEIIPEECPFSYSDATVCGYGPSK